MKEHNQNQCSFKRFAIWMQSLWFPQCDCDGYKVAQRQIYNNPELKTHPCLLGCGNSFYAGYQRNQQMKLCALNEGSKEEKERLRKMTTQRKWIYKIDGVRIQEATVSKLISQIPEGLQFWIIMLRVFLLSKISNVKENRKIQTLLQNLDINLAKLMWSCRAKI